MAATETYYEYVREWTERAAATRWPIERNGAVDAEGCDGVLAEPVAGRPAGTPVEVKAAKGWVKDRHCHNGERRGRWKINPSHEWLVEEEGEYALVVYDRANVAGADVAPVLIYRIALLRAATVDSLIPDSVSLPYRLTWGRVFEQDADRAYQTGYEVERGEQSSAKREAAADARESDTDPVQEERMHAVLDAIQMHEDLTEQGAPWGGVAAHLDAQGIDEDDALHALEKLCRKGEVYEPEVDHYRSTARV